MFELLERHWRSIAYGLAGLLILLGVLWLDAALSKSQFSEVFVSDAGSSQTLSPTGNTELTAEQQLELAREQEARRQAEEAEGEARLMAEVSEALDASLELSETLQGLVEALVPRLADWCTLDLLEEGDGPRRFAAAGDAAVPEPNPRLAED